MIPAVDGSNDVVATNAWFERGAGLPGVDARALPSRGNCLRRGAAQEIWRGRARRASAAGARNALGDDAEEEQDEDAEGFLAKGGVLAKGFLDKGVLANGVLAASCFLANGFPADGVLADGALVSLGGVSAWADGRTEVDSFLGDGVDGGSLSLAARERNTIRPRAGAGCPELVQNGYDRMMRV